MIETKRDGEDAYLVVSHNLSEKIEADDEYGIHEIWPDSLWYNKAYFSIHGHGIDGNLIATIRELEVLKDEFGEISRKTLGIPFGETNQLEEKTYYKLKDIWKIPDYIYKKYAKIAGRDMLPLAKALLNAKDESEFTAHFIRHELQKE